MVYFSRDMIQNGGKCPSCNVSESFKNFPSCGCGCGWLNWKWFVQRYIWWNFHEAPISSFQLKLLTDKHTNTGLKHNLLGGANKIKSLSSSTKWYVDWLRFQTTNWWQLSLDYNVGKRSQFNNEVSKENVIIDTLNYI